MAIRSVVICASCCFFWSYHVVGKTQENLENQKEIYNRLKENQQKDILYFGLEKAPSTDQILGKTGHRCIEIKRIKGDTLTLLSTQEKNRLFLPFENSCSTIAELNNLVKQLSALYLERGYVTSKVYLKPQAIKEDGTIEVYAIEGKVSNVSPDSSYIRNAFLGQKGDYLNLRDLERSIETINSLPSNHATMKLVPGVTVGTTKVQIENKTTNRINGHLRVDNFGEKSTGKLQGSLDVNFDNPLGVNDQLTVFINSTEKHRRKQSSSGGGYQYKLPIGNRFSTAFKYRKTVYKKIIPAGITDYDSDGNTSTYQVDLSNKIFHNKNHRVDIGSAITHYKAENYISDSLIETSSYRVSKLGVRADYLYQEPNFYTFTSFIYYKGITWFDEKNPTDLDPKASFYNIDLSLVKQFSNVKYSLNAHYQKAHNALFSINQISIGGPYSVRGYKNEGLSGNSGYYVRHEFSKVIRTKVFESIEQNYFCAFDHGYIEAEDDVEGGHIQGATIGGIYTYKDFKTQVYYSVPLHHDNISKTSDFLGFSLSYNF